MVDRFFKESETITPISYLIDAQKKSKNIGGFRVLKEIIKSDQQLQELNIEWTNKMAYGKEQLRERMTFFWHNHFETQVAFGILMQSQNNSIREHALGNFKDLLFADAKDPPMILYLNNHQNKKTAPNENFTREVMELFTLGIGSYSEQETKEAARAFTGW